MGVVCSERSRVPLGSTPLLARAPGDNGRSSARGQAFKKCVVLRCACARSPRYLKESRGVRDASSFFKLRVSGVIVSPPSESDM